MIQEGEGHWPVVVHLSDHNRVMVAQVDYYNFDLAMAIHSSKSFEMPLLWSAFSNARLVTCYIITA